MKSLIFIGVARDLTWLIRYSSARYFYSVRTSWVVTGKDKLYIFKKGQRRKDT